MSSTQFLDFKTVNNAILANPSYLQRRLPQSVNEGSELVAGDIHGNKGKSFKINLESGLWSDFATGEKGSDPISLVAAQEGIGQGEALRLVADELGLSALAPLARKSKGLPKCPISDENIVASYCYRDEQGDELFYSFRYEKEGHRKDFRQGAYTPTGIAWGTKGIRRVLYNLAHPVELPTVLTSSFVVVVEGESKADALIRMGICGTCNIGGAKNWKNEYAESLRGKNVVILPDNDSPGREHAENVAKSLVGVAESIKVVELPGLPEKGDILDWLTVVGNDKERLQSIIDDAHYYQAEQISRAAIDVNDFLKIKLKAREYVLYPVLPEKGIVLVFAYRGLGKTLLALSMGDAVACGAPLFNTGSRIDWFAPKPRKVLYVDGEMAQVEMQDRLRAIRAGSQYKLESGFFNIITPEQLPLDETMPNLATPKGQAWLEPYLEGIDLIILDNIATLFGRQQENTAESWQFIQKWLLSLRKNNKTILLIHHAGKNGEQRDTSAKEDTLDASVRLRRPDDYLEEEGARFIVEFTKARGLCGTAIMPFEASLSWVDGKAQWVAKDIGDENFTEVIALAKVKVSYRAIAAELDISFAKVQRLINKAKKLGLL